jgi:cell division transport system permease protein
MASQNHKNMWRMKWKHGFRNVKRGGLPFYFAAFMIGLGLFGFAVFGTVLLNFEQLAERVGTAVGAVAFLDVTSKTEAQQIRAEIEALSTVKTAELVTPQNVMLKAMDGLEENNALLTEAEGLSLPWAVEISRSLDVQNTSMTHLLAQLDEVKGVGQIMHAGAEIRRLKDLTEVLFSVGLYLAILIGIITMIVVGNTVKLTVLARKDEIALMKLVGATDAFVRDPFLIEGLLQGLLGGASATLGVMLTHQTLAGLLRNALSDAFGVFELAPLSLQAHVGLLLLGALLGLMGAAFSMRRHLRV